MMGAERLNNDSETVNSGGTNPWEEAMRDAPPFGGEQRQEQQEDQQKEQQEPSVKTEKAHTESSFDESELYYKNAKAMLNGTLFNLDNTPAITLGEGLAGDSRMYDFPSYMAEGYGLEEGIEACDQKLQSAKVSTPEENGELYNLLNDTWLDMEEEAYQNDDGDKEAYAQLMRETLDGLVGDIRDFEDGNVQSLESVANHQIAKETKKYLQRLQLGTLTDEYKADYAKRVTALIEVRGALHHQNQLKKMNIEPLPASTSEDDGEVGDDDMDKEKIDTEETREEQEVIARQSAQYEETKQRQRERWQQQREAEQKRREEQERINRARQAVVEAARQSRAEQTTQETNSRLSENEKTPASYQIEAGIGTPETTITVGQEIPASWFEAKTLGEERGGFGIHITKPPLIESFLQDILNTEFSKIDQAERKDYDYAAISRKLKEEAGRTRKIPDVAAVIQANKLVMENEDEMEM